ncbi:hypothetical protein MMC21_003215 [Puttea exsequens]|nr:hypothetical protein [Puttea exsequens]
MDHKQFKDVKTADTSLDASRTSQYPPPYVTVTEQPVDSEGKPQSSAQNPWTGETSASAEYPAQPHHTQSITRTLHVRYEKWRSNVIQVFDTDESTLLYTVAISMKKPHMTFESASTKSTVGTANFHYTSFLIDTTVHGQPVTFTPHGLLKSSYTYPSPALNNATMTWKGQGAHIDLVCLDEHGAPLAKFRSDHWSFTKCGKLDIFGSKAYSGAVLEEVLVTGLALGQFYLTTSVATVAAAT